MNTYSRIIALLISVCLIACGDTDSSPAPQGPNEPAHDMGEDAGAQTDAMAVESDMETASVPCEEAWTVNGINLELRCGDTYLQFVPEVLVNDNWSTPSQCDDLSNDGLRCSVAGAGTLEMTRTGSVWRTLFTADQAVVFDGFRFRGNGRIADVESWLSNGFQSWSQSGLIEIGARYSDVAITTALRAQGDLEVVRGGKELSWWLSYAVAPTNLIAGATSARNFKTWIQLNQEGNEFYCTITSGQTKDNVAMAAGNDIQGEDIWISLNPDLNVGLTAYADALPSRIPRIAEAEAGWNSWYELWDDIDQDDILENARMVPGILDAVTFEEQRPYRIVVDDGWQIQWGEWRANDGFPGGMSATAALLASENFKPGIWMAPLLVHENSSLVSAHPDWFLPEASFTHLAHGKMRILDVTHPEAANKLRTDVQHLVDAGFGLLKIDFLFAGTYTSPRHQPMPAMRAYELALSIIREAAGPETILLAVGSPPISGFDSVDAWRLGPDIAVQLFDASWYFVQGTARSSAARWPFCIHTLCDGDPALLRTLPREEVEAGAWIAALGGGAFFLSDDLRDLEPERTGWITRDMTAQGLSGMPAIPASSKMMQVPGQLNSQLLEQSRQQATHRVPLQWTLHDDRTLWLNITDETQASDGGDLAPRRAVLAP